jgi:hypothetical protein
MNIPIYNIISFSSSLRRSTLAEVSGGGGGLLRQPLFYKYSEDSGPKLNIRSRILKPGTNPF